MQRPKKGRSPDIDQTIIACASFSAFLSIVKMVQTEKTLDLDEEKKNISQKQLIRYRKKMNSWQTNELHSLIDMQENAVDAVKLEWLMKDRKMKIKEEGET